jgi:hypothetical protein
MQIKAIVYHHTGNEISFPVWQYMIYFLFVDFHIFTLYLIDQPDDDDDDRIRRNL